MKLSIPPSNDRYLTYRVHFPGNEDRKPTMKSTIIVLMSIFFCCQTAHATDRDIEGYYKFYWTMSIDRANDKCGTRFAAGRERESYFCNQLDQFEGVDFSKGFGKARKAGLFLPSINNTILKFQNVQLYEVDLVFEGKKDADPVTTRKNLLGAYKDFLNILVLEYGAPKKSFLQGEISLYDRLDAWNFPSGCIVLQVLSESLEGHVKLMYKEKCGNL
jgi:hypothetical protein